MSRKVTITSAEEIVEVDLAEEVVKELRLPSLTFDSTQLRFANVQYDDDVGNSAIQRAERLYYDKRKQRNMEKVEAALRRRRYQVKKVHDKNTNKVKIVATQRVYA